MFDALGMKKSKFKEGNTDESFWSLMEAVNQLAKDH